LYRALAVCLLAPASRVDLLERRKAVLSRFKRVHTNILGSNLTIMWILLNLLRKAPLAGSEALMLLDG
jgi:hypothetical protein